MSAMLVVMTVRTVLKVPFEKAAPRCPSDVLTPLVLPSLAERWQGNFLGLDLLRAADEN